MVTMHNRARLRARNELTQRLARTIRETDSDPLDWWEGPIERNHVIGYGGHMRPPVLQNARRDSEPAQTQWSSGPARVLDYLRNLWKRH